MKKIFALLFFFLLNLSLPALADFNPLTIPGLVSWYDASNPSNLVLGGTNGNLISEWYDISGQKEHLFAFANTAETTYVPNSLNGLAGVYFINLPTSGAIKFLYTKNDVDWSKLIYQKNGYTLFIVANPQNSGSTTIAGIFLNTGLSETNNRYSFYDSVLKPSQIYMSGGGLGSQNLGAPSSISPYGNHIFDYRQAYPGTQSIILDGTIIASQNTPTGPLTNPYCPMGLGAFPYCPQQAGQTGAVPNYGYNGYMYEVLFYSQYLSLVNYQAVEGYLACKWGLQSNLPSNHPYKTLCPSTLMNSAGSESPIGSW